MADQEIKPNGKTNGRAKGLVKGRDLDPTTGRFLAGNGGGGRYPGVRNKLGEAFIQAVASDFAKHGPHTIRRVRILQPAEYLRMIVAMLPKQFDLNVARKPIEDLTDEELDALLRELHGVLSPIIEGRATEVDTRRPRRVGSSTRH